VQGKVECGMSSSPQTATWRSGIPIAVNLLDMTVVGPTDMGIPEHEHPGIQISMTFVAHSPPGTTKAVWGFPTYFSLHPSGMPHGRKSDGAESLATVFSQAYIEQAADELLKRPSSEIISAPCAVDPVIVHGNGSSRRALTGARPRSITCGGGRGRIDRASGSALEFAAKSSAGERPVVGTPDSQRSGSHRALSAFWHSRPRPCKTNRHWGLTSSRGFSGKRWFAVHTAL